MEDGVTIGVLNAVVLASLAGLKFVGRHLSVIVAVMVIAGTVACSEYLIATPVIGIMGLCALAWLYELLVKLEKRWDRALEARRCRNRLRRAKRHFAGANHRSNLAFQHSGFKLIGDDHRFVCLSYSGDKPHERQKAAPTQ